MQLFSIEIIAKKAVLHLVTHHLHKNSFHCFSLQPPAWHTLFSFNCVFFFPNDLFRAFRCTGILRICCFDAVDLPGRPVAVIGKLHTGIYGGSHKMDRIRVSCHQIGTQTFARRQAGGNAGLQRKERCFILLAQTEEKLAANGQILAAVEGPACLHRVLPIKDVIAAIPKADLRIILLFADI